MGVVDGCGLWQFGLLWVVVDDSGDGIIYYFNV